MSKVKVYNSKQINEQKWNACIDSGQQKLVYAYTWYLNGMCEHWIGLVYGDYEAVMPLPIRKKWGLFNYVYQVAFIQRLGVFGNEKRAADLYKYIPKRIVLIDSFVNLLDQFPVRNNYILNLNTSYKNLLSNYNSDAKKNLRKLEQVSYEQGNFSDCIALYKETWGALNPKITLLDYSNFETTCAIAQKNNKLLCVKMMQNEQLLATAIVLKSGNRLHNVCAAITSAGRTVGAMHGIIDYFIKTHAQQDFIFDFEGSELPNVAQFYLKFGPQVEKYSHVVKKFPGFSF